jgi:hypothetical protein
MTQRRKQAWRKWRKLISQQAKSGQSVAAFCRERGLCAPHFFAWKKRLTAGESKKFVEMKVPRAMTQPAVVVGIEIRLKNDHRLLVPPGFDGHHLQALLAILETRA